MPAAGWRDGGDRSTSQRLDKSPQTQTRHDYRTVSDQNWTYIPNQFLCVHWSWWENSKQCIFSRLKKVYPTTSDMLSFASVRQLWNLPTSILLDLNLFFKKASKHYSFNEEGDVSYFLSQSQWDMVKMLVLKTPNCEWKDRMVCLHWSCSRQQLSVFEKTPARGETRGTGGLKTLSGRDKQVCAANRCSAFRLCRKPERKTF